VFDELLAIPAIGGNVSTTSFSDYIQSLAAGIDFHGRRLVAHAAVVEYELTGIFSVFFHDAPVTRHSPVVFDAFANQTKV